MEYKDYQERLKRFGISADSNPQDFFTVLCWDYEVAARFVLDWAVSSVESAAHFVSSFLALVRQELNLASSELNPKSPANAKLRSPGTSVCRIALLRFCELLNENPSLIRNIQSQRNYSVLGRAGDFFGSRETNTIALTRGTAWEARDFEDPSPIALSARQSYHQRERSISILEHERRERERLAEQELKRQKKQKQYSEAAAKQLQMKEQSERRRLFREEFLKKPLIVQVSILATDNTWPVTALPIHPDAITEDLLRQLSCDSLSRLEIRIAGRWEARWKGLLGRIHAVKGDSSQTAPVTEGSPVPRKGQ